MDLQSALLLDNDYGKAEGLVMSEAYYSMFQRLLEEDICDDSADYSFSSDRSWAILVMGVN